MPSNNAESESNNKRIAKNTVFLYARTFLSLLIGLYVSRLFLKEFGVTDFGIYNLVGGIVVLFSFVNNAMATASQRFFNFELGKFENGNIGEVFSASFKIHLAIALSIVVLGEILGLYIVNYIINIPAEMYFATNVVYQFVLFSTAITIVGTPFTALVIAHERLEFFAYITLLTPVLKLLSVIVIARGFSEKLILYSISIFVITALVQSITAFYCIRILRTTSFKTVKDGTLFRRLISFSGWSMLGSMSNASKEYGLGIIFNYFCGVAVNAAIGVGTQVGSAVYQFVLNLQTAFNPQITKYCAAKDMDNFIKLIFQSSKYSFFLIWMIALPLLATTDYVLEIWLDNVPEFASQIVAITIVYMIFDALSGSLWTSVYAIGNIRNYQIYITVILISILPISYGMLALGYGVVAAFSVKAVVNAVAYVWRIFYLKTLFLFPSGKYIKTVLCKIVSVIAISSVATTSVLYCFPVENAANFITVCVVSELSVLFSIFLAGMNRNERTKCILAAKGSFARIANRL